MDGFPRIGGELRAEKIPLADIAARFGTPCYVYSRCALVGAFESFRKSFPRANPLICYAVKANGNLSLLSILAELGAGFDIVSGGELARVKAAGGDWKKTVFSGVGKSRDEINEALAVGVMALNVESESELNRIEESARAAGIIAPISVRLNPDVDAKTHPYVSTGLAAHKFGLAESEAIALMRRAKKSPHLRAVGLSSHIGSQVGDDDAFVAAAKRVAEAADKLKKEKIPLAHIDLGGGFAVDYQGDSPPSDWQKYDRALESLFDLTQVRIVLEPGRAIVARAGILLTRIEYLKKNGARNFAVVDAAMNDFLRPALYDAHHRIEAVATRPEESRLFQIVGPVCESADRLGEANLAISEGDLLAVRDAGGYGMAMSSNYNARLRPCEILADGESAKIIRRRESIIQMLSPER